jgi:hypothetical protein
MRFTAGERPRISDGVCAVICPTRITRMNKKGKYPGPPPDSRNIRTAVPALQPASGELEVMSRHFHVLTRRLRFFPGRSDFNS